MENLEKNTFRLENNNLADGENKDNFKVIIENSNTSDSFMMKGQPIVVRINGEVKKFAGNGIFSEVVPWSVLCDALGVSRLQDGVAEISVVENGVQRSILYTYPSDAVYDPFENNPISNILDLNESADLIKKRISKLAEISREVYRDPNLCYKLAPSIALVDKKASEFLVEVMKSSKLNKALIDEKVTNPVSQVASDDKLKADVLSELDNTDRIASSVNYLMYLQQSMWELGCFSDTISDIRVFGVDSVRKCLDNSACLTRMGIEDNVFATSILSNAEEIKDDNKRIQRDFYLNAEKFMRSQEEVSRRYRKGILKLSEEASKVGEFFGTFLEVGEAELHKLAKKSQEMHVKLSCQIGQPSYS